MTTARAATTTTKAMSTSPTCAPISDRCMLRPMSRKMSELAMKAAYSQTVSIVTRVTGLMVRVPAEGCRARWRR